MQFIGRYSYLFLSVVALGLVWGLVVKVPSNATGLLIFIGLLAVLVTLWVALFRGKSPPNPDKRLKKSVGSGRPVLVHFYSDFCLGCMVRKPVVDRLEKRFKGRVEFLHISLSDPHGRELAARLGSGLGQFILYDGKGQERLRGARVPRADDLTAALKNR